MTLKFLEINRRRMLALCGGVCAFFGVGAPSASFATARLRDAMNSIIGGREVRDGRVVLDIADITENGASVLVGVQVDSPMTDADHVTAVHLFAELNPDVEVISFRLTPMAGKIDIITRIRLAQSQTVHAIAEMNDGSVYVAKKYTTVTIGGCGGGN